jgi:hypothetical protein
MKKKTAVINMMVDPQVKSMAVDMAWKQRRSLTSYIEGLILADQVHEKEAGPTSDVTPTVISTVQHIV